MPQYAYPNADISNPGSWTSTGASHWTEIDEVIASGGDFIASPGNPTNATDIVALSSLVDPGVTADHIIRVFAGKNAGGGSTLNFTCALWQGSSFAIAALAVGDIGSPVSERTVTLSGAEADTITDYGALQFRFTAQTIVADAGRLVIVAQAEFQVPDVHNRRWMMMGYGL